MSRPLLLLNLVLLSCYAATVVHAAEPLVPKPAQLGIRKPPPPIPPPPAPALPPRDPNEVDWRGLGDGPKKKPTAHDSAVSDLIRNAPYRVSVATSDGIKLSLTNALTLERRKVFEGPSVAAFGFSPDGAWLYVITLDGELFAIEPDSATVEPIGKLPLAPEQVAVELVGGGSLQEHEFTVWLAKGPAPATGTCPTWREPQRVRVTHRPHAKGAAIAPAQPGWAEPPEATRSNPMSPSTRYRAHVEGGSLTASACFGGGQFKLNRTALPTNVTDLQWMRDSDGVVASFARKPTNGCRQRPGIRVWRQENRPGVSGWREWTTPDNLDIARPDTHAGPQWAPDGMRLVGVEPRGVVLIEPSPRFRGQVALIAPPSKLWPKFRPGVRPLPASAPPAQRHAELLLEQGDIDAAAKLLRGVKESEAPTLFAHLKKLEEVRLRRAEELQLDVAELRSDKTQRAAPKPPVEAPSVPLPRPTTPDAGLAKPATASTAPGSQ